MRPTHLIVTSVLTLAVGVASADGNPRCKRVNGHFEASIVPPGEGHCPSAPNTLCTAGRVRGGIQGTYEFVQSGVHPSVVMGGVPTVIFYTGQSTVSLKSGDELIGTDTGAIDVPPGQGGFASLITWTGGSGRMSEATGQIRLNGELDAASGTTAGDYTGTVCTS
jgi:hypothetical protein